MSKRYVIQVNVNVNGPAFEAEWQNVQHPQGGDWLTRSSSTAIADAAKLVNAGETRELRIGVSKPVYEVTPAIDFEQIKAAEAAINWTDAGDFEDDVDEDEEEDAEDGSESDTPIVFELVDEPGSDGNAHNNDGPAYTHGDDPTGN